METHGVVLGYVGDKIRYILIIRVRFTTEFFFEHGFIGLTRMFRSWWYCLPDSTPPFIKSVESVQSVFVLPPSFFFSNTDLSD